MHVCVCVCVGGGGGGGGGGVNFFIQPLSVEYARPHMMGGGGG